MNTYPKTPFDSIWFESQDEQYSWLCQNLDFMKSTKVKKSQTPSVMLGLACIWGKMDVVSVYLKKNPNLISKPSHCYFLNEKDRAYHPPNASLGFIEGRMTPIFLAIMGKNYPLIEMLIKHPGLQKNQSIPNWTIPQAVCCMLSKSDERTQILKMLFKKGFDFLQSDGSGSTALSSLVQQGDSEAIQLLLNPGLDLSNLSKIDPGVKEIGKSLESLINYAVTNPNSLAPIDMVSITHNLLDAGFRLPRKTEDTIRLHFPLILVQRDKNHLQETLEKSSCLKASIPRI